MKTIDIQENQLEGPLPVTLNSLERLLEYLYVDRNPQLLGCIPLSAFTTASFVGTQVVGRCADSIAQDAAHEQQRNAIRTNFVSTLGVGADRQFRSMLQLVVSEINQTLGSSVQPGQTSKVFLQNHPQGDQRGFCKVSVTLIDGIEYITAIEVGITDRVSSGGLNLQRLLVMLPGLPRLQTFACERCDSAVSRTNRLPPRLPTVAPNLVKLNLFASGIVGAIPSSYGNFAQMQELLMGFNGLSGQLPAELSRLQKLTVLFLQGNNFDSECQFVRDWQSSVATW
jgi:hypothetical protein